MKMKSCFVGAAATTVLAASAFGQVFTSAAVPATISDNTLTMVDVVVSGGPASITQLSVVMDITHTYDADIDMVLVAPDLRYIHLSTDNGGGNDNYTFARFSTCGSGPIATGVAPFSGNYVPEGGDASLNGWAATNPALPGPFVGSLAGFNGSNANGTWQLWVFDDLGGDFGTVNHLSLEFNGSLDPLGPVAPGGSNPSGTGAATPAAGLPGDSTLMTIAVSPGGCPASTGLTVTADLSQLGGSATQAFLDNGTGGDLVAGDGVYSRTVTTPANQGGGNFVVNYTINDAQARSGSGTLNYHVSAAPAVFTDLGDHSTTSAQLTQDVTINSPTDIQWYRVVLPTVSAAGYVDLWTTEGGANPMTDVEIGIYDNSGNLLGNDDDSGVGLQSALSYGLGSGQLIGDVGNLGGDGIGNGENGALAGGTCWVAVGRYPVVFNTGFDVVSTNAGTQTTGILNVAIAPPTAPFPPLITSVIANPSPALAGASVLLTAAVTPGGNPVSTGLAARVDLSSLGGSATQTMYDDGTHGDVAAGDGTFSYSYAISAGALEANYTVAITASDAQARTASRNLAFNVITPAQWEESVSAPGGDAGDLPNTAAEVSGSGSLNSIGGNLGAGDVDMYVIQICEPANFSASLVNTHTTFDTQMFLFDTNGTGIVMNDDNALGGGGLQSALTSAFTASLPTGNYLLAVASYDNDPFNSLGAAIWEDQPFGAERAPDGLASGGDNVVTSWDANNTNNGGGYRLNLTGACFSGGSSNCVADVDDGTGTGVQDGAVTIEDLLYFLVQFEAGGINADVDNGTSTGTTDGAVTIDDLLYFLIRFEQGC